MIHVLFVCLGNICRSPTAHGVFRHRVEQAGLGSRIDIDSAGTGDWHIGRPPDHRTLAAARVRGYDLSDLRARQVAAIDFDRFHYVLAMDRTNLADLQRMCPPHFEGALRLFLDYADGHAEPVDATPADAAGGTVKDARPAAGRDVPDPYYDEADGFDTVLDLVEAACDGLLADIKRRYPQVLA